MLMAIVGPAGRNNGHFYFRAFCYHKITLKILVVEMSQHQL